MSEDIQSTMSFMDAAKDPKETRYTTRHYVLGFPDNRENPIGEHLMGDIQDLATDVPRMRHNTTASHSGRSVFNLSVTAPNNAIEKIHDVVERHMGINADTSEHEQRL